MAFSGWHRKKGIEAALRAYFFKMEQAQARAQRQQSIETMTATIILEKCQEADRRRDLVLLYGPPGIGKTFPIEEFIDRSEKQDTPDKSEGLFETTHSASTLLGRKAHCGLDPFRGICPRRSWGARGLELSKR